MPETNPWIDNETHQTINRYCDQLIEVAKYAFVITDNDSNATLEALQAPQDEIELLVACRDFFLITNNINENFYVRYNDLLKNTKRIADKAIALQHDFNAFYNSLQGSTPTLSTTVYVELAAEGLFALSDTLTTEFTDYCELLFQVLPIISEKKDAWEETIQHYDSYIQRFLRILGLSHQLIEHRLKSHRDPSRFLAHLKTLEKTIHDSLYSLYKPLKQRSIEPKLYRELCNEVKIDEGDTFILEAKTLIEKELMRLKKASLEVEMENNLTIQYFGYKSSTAYKIRKRELQKEIKEILNYEATRDWRERITEGNHYKLYENLDFKKVIQEGHKDTKHIFQFPNEKRRLQWNFVDIHQAIKRVITQFVKLSPQEQYERVPVYLDCLNTEANHALKNAHLYLQEMRCVNPETGKPSATPEMEQALLTLRAEVPQFTKDMEVLLSVPAPQTHNSHFFQNSPPINEEESTTSATNSLNQLTL